jgi:hypothetical protein
MANVGFGSTGDQACINVYIANRPPMDQYEHLSTLESLSSGDIFNIAHQTGNHWRKIFNVYAKFMYGLLLTPPGPFKTINPENISRWQQYRDEILLQSFSDCTLLFSQPNFIHTNAASVHIIMGKVHASELGWDRDTNKELTVLDRDFAICPSKKLIICPYFDYRQLSNLKIERLVKLIHELCEK